MTGWDCRGAELPHDAPCHTRLLLTEVLFPGRGPDGRDGSRLRPRLRRLCPSPPRTRPPSREPPSSTPDGPAGARPREDEFRRPGCDPPAAGGGRHARPRRVSGRRGPRHRGARRGRGRLGLGPPDARRGWPRALADLLAGPHDAAEGRRAPVAPARAGANAGGRAGARASQPRPRPASPVPRARARGVARTEPLQGALASGAAAGASCQRSAPHRTDRDQITGKRPVVRR